MQLLHDRGIAISRGNSRKATQWIRENTTVGAFYESLKTPFRSAETQADFFRLKKSEQDALKDARGGFVGGVFRGARRKAIDVTGRDLVTLDLDTIEPYGTQNIIAEARLFGVSFVIYSTRKHTPERPRLRVILPLDRTVSADEYEPIARRVAEAFGIKHADPTTFDVSRLFYWPTCSADAEYIFEYGDGVLLSADTMLKSYTDWRDYREWPVVPGHETDYKREAVKQGDPTQKPGIVGAFCRVYDIYSAMQHFLLGIYAQSPTDPTRYTYLNGSTTGGAIVYEGGQFLYSHHATDPCSGRLVNAFDLVRLHKFADLDKDADPATPTNKLKSYEAMCRLAVADKRVIAERDRAQRAEAVADFEGVAQSSGAKTPGSGNDNAREGQKEATQNKDSAPDLWLQSLDRNEKTGALLQTIKNVRIILNNDDAVKGRLAFDDFASKSVVKGRLPWDSAEAENYPRAWTDTDISGLYWYLENIYGITKRNAIDDGFNLCVADHSYNDVTDYLDGLQWDGTPRLDTLFVDYLGAEDNAYTRAVTRKAFTAAVARAYRPGTKFDNMIILCGPQGIGKSTILDKLSRGWYNDSIRTFEGKEASELLQGAWIVEVAELDAFRRTDVSRIKQFLSLKYDRYRAAYGRTVKECPRRCVFFGTCNQTEFLQDTTGNRRFWPLDVGKRTPKKRVFKDLDNEIDQIWAEAKYRYIGNPVLGVASEPLYLSGDVAQYAESIQEAHREADFKEGLIIDFLNEKVPDDWQTWDLARRRDYWSLNVKGSYKLTERVRICAAEVLCELFGFSPKNISRADSREVNAILASLDGWRKSERPQRCGPYAIQRCFVRKATQEGFEL